MEFVKMSKKGQIVVPKALRVKLGLSSQDKFIAYGRDDYIIFKKIELPSLKREFEEIAEMATKIARERGITEKDVKDEIKRYREEKRAR